MVDIREAVELTFSYHPLCYKTSNGSQYIFRDFPFNISTTSLESTNTTSEECKCDSGPKRVRLVMQSYSGSAGLGCLGASLSSHWALPEARLIRPPPMSELKLDMSHTVWHCARDFCFAFQRQMCF